jgi:hypothetical protein
VLKRLLGAALAVCRPRGVHGSAGEAGALPEIPIPVQHTYRPMEGPVFESWSTERGLSRRNVPQPESFAAPNEATFSWNPLPDGPPDPTQNHRTSLRYRLRNFKKENAPPGVQWYWVALR